MVDAPANRRTASDTTPSHHHVCGATARGPQSVLLPHTSILYVESGNNRARRGDRCGNRTCMAKLGVGVRFVSFVPFDFFWLLKNCGHLKIRTELHRRKCGTELFGLRLFRFGFGHERTNRTKLLQ